MSKTPKFSTTFYKKTVFKTVLLIVSVFSICLIVCAVSIYKNDTKTLRNTAVTQTTTTLNNLNSVFDNASRICAFFSSYQDFSPVFQTYTDMNLRKSTMMSEISTFISCNEYIEAIKVDTGDYVVSSGSLDNNKKYAQLCDFNTFKVNYPSNNEWPFNLVISNSKSDVLSFNTDVVISSLYLGRNYFGEDTFCVSKTGEIILANNTKYLGENIQNIFNIPFNDLIKTPSHGKYILSATPLSNDGGYIITVIDSLSFENSILLQATMLVLACISVLAVGIILCIYSFKKVYRPIDKMVQLFKYYLPTNERFVEEDIQFISECVNESDYDENTKQAVIQLRKSQLYTLHSQISPHFLANSLDIIKWKSIEVLGAENPIEDSLGVLSGFLAETQSYKKMFCSIEEEIERTREYERLAKYCFNKNLTVNWNTDSDILKYSIVSLSFQPLFENSIIHGFAQKMYDEPANIDVSIKNEQDDIRIIISDNGCGMESDILKEIKSILNDDKPCEHYIGIKNTHLKLKTLYGEKYGITDIISNSAGTEFKILIPKRIYPPIDSLKD